MNDPKYSISNGVATLTKPHYILVRDVLIIVDRGYRWNGANIPHWLWPIFGTPFDTIHAIPSLDHDRLYEVGYMHFISRREADAKYRRDIIARGQPRLLAWLEWANIRIFGRKYWKDF